MKNNNLDIFEELIIAEVGSVHDGSFGNACKLIELASSSGANIVKFQTHIASNETLRNAPDPPYFNSESRYNYFERTSFSKEQWKELKITCEKNNVIFMSSPFSIEALEILESIDTKLYKIPSGEINNIPLIEKVSKIGKPVLISSGMSSWAELDLAVNILSKKCPLTIMQCTSIYPCPPEKVGLNIIPLIKERYGKDISVGFSDHTTSYNAAIAAVALGANIIEKHLTFSKFMYGSDASLAMEPLEFKRFCSELKSLWISLKNPIDKNNLEELKDMKEIFEKSIVSARDIKSGEKISFKDLAFKKPGIGIPTKDYKKIMGLEVKYDISADHLFNKEDFV